MCWSSHFITYTECFNSSHAAYSTVQNVHYNQSYIIFTFLPVTPGSKVDLHAYLYNDLYKRKVSLHSVLTWCEYPSPRTTFSIN